MSKDAPKEFYVVTITFAVEKLADSDADRDRARDAMAGYVRYACAFMKAEGRASHVAAIVMNDLTVQEVREL